MNYLRCIGLMSFCFLLSQVIAQKSDIPTRHYLDYFASHLKLTQQKLSGQDNHATVVAFEGELNKEYFIKALEMLFRAHSNLRVKKIKYDKIEKLFYFDEELIFSDIFIKFIDIDDKEDWQKIVDKELSHPFPGEGPYWKVYCLSVKKSQTARHYLIQFFDHSLCDGISTAKLNDEFFIYYDALVNKKKIELVKDNKIDALTTLGLSEKQCSWQEYKKKQEKLSKLYPLPAKSANYEKQCPLNQRSTKAILVSFELEPIYEICKKHGFTVNDLLVSSSLLALRNNHPSQVDESFDTSVLTCVDLRNPRFDLQNKISVNNLACLFNIIVQPEKIEAESTIWQVAKNYHKLSNLYIDQLALPPKDFSLDEIINGYRFNLIDKRKHFPRGIATSNLGKIDLKKQYGDIDIIFYQFFSNQGVGFFEALLDVSCVENTIYCNITYVEPLHSRKWAIQLVSHFIHELQLVLPNRLTLVESGTDKDVLEAEKMNFW